MSQEVYPSIIINSKMGNDGPTAYRQLRIPYKIPLDSSRLGQCQSPLRRPSNLNSIFGSDQVIERSKSMQAFKPKSKTDNQEDQATQLARVHHSNVSRRSNAEVSEQKAILQAQLRELQAELSALQMRVTQSKFNSGSLSPVEIQRKQNGGQGFFPSEKYRRRGQYFRLKGCILEQ